MPECLLPETLGQALTEGELRLVLVDNCILNCVIIFYYENIEASLSTGWDGHRSGACLRKQPGLNRGRCPASFSLVGKCSFVAKGNTRAEINGTGVNTGLGKIASLVQQAEQAWGGCRKIKMR